MQEADKIKKLMKQWKAAEKYMLKIAGDDPQSWDERRAAVLAEAYRKIYAKATISCQSERPARTLYDSLERMMGKATETQSWQMFHHARQQIGEVVTS